MIELPERVDAFRPPPALANPHVQTLLGRALRARTPSRYERVRLDTADDDFVDLDVWSDRRSEPRGVCLLLHGLEGSAGSGYVVATASALAGVGILPIALNFRSCSGEPNRRAASYHSGHTADIELALAWMADAFAVLPRFAVGFSLGGNALLVLLGRDGGRPVDAAAAVSVPYDLSACASALENGGRLYARYFLRSLRAKAREKATRFPGEVPEAAASASTVREFDELLTAPLGGFADAEDYYHRCSAGRYVEGVEVPTLLIQAADDPLVPHSTFPRAALHPPFTVDVTAHGGHVGFVDARRRVGPDGWMEQRIARFFEGIARASSGV